MKKSLITALILSTSLIGLSACQQNAADLPPGTYVNKSSTTNRDGTDVKNKTVTEVGYDEYGNKTAVVKQKTTKDPEGLFNKSTSKSTTVVK